MILFLVLVVNSDQFQILQSYTLKSPIRTLAEIPKPGDIAGVESISGYHDNMNNVPFPVSPY